MSGSQQLGLGALVVFIIWWMRPRTATVSTSYAVAINDSPIGRVAHAIAVAEGFYDGDTVPYRANNPGALQLGEPAIAAAGGQRITWFESAMAGWEALHRQLRLILDGRSAHYTRSTTLAQMGLTWSGGDANWAINVAGVLNVPTSTQLGSLLS